jgi:pimeloyl-ACP methyl ester carboxylesterase
MGGAVLDLDLESPERAETLVLVGAAVGGFEFDEGKPEEWDELVAADEAGDLERVFELEVRIWVDGPRCRPDVLDPAMRDLVREMNLIALKNEPCNWARNTSLRHRPRPASPRYRPPPSCSSTTRTGPAPWLPPT